MKRYAALLIALWGLGVWIPDSTYAQPASATRLSPTKWVVSPEGPFTTPQAALAAARDGDVIEVHAGVYPGPLIVDRSVTLEGVDWPIVDGHDQGTVVLLSAPGIVFRGFVIQGSGIEPDQDHSGITLTAPRIRVENNRLADVLFGIFVSQADEAILRGNDISSKTQFDLGRKGDSIRVWYSQGILIEDNRVHDARDVVMWYATDAIVRNNIIETGRYGIHLMYCNNALIEENHIQNNAVGVYTMYTERTVVRNNVIRHQHGTNGYALGFKDANDVHITDNLLVDNHVGAYLDGTPFRPGSAGDFSRNIFAFNDIGVVLLPSIRGNVFSENTFWENIEQVAIQGGNGSAQNEWAGNYWSDYMGFDANADGRGDVPYRSERTFENLTDREPRLVALIYSPVAQTIEFAASAFPIVKPQPKLIDPSPIIHPAVIPDALTARGNPVPWVLAALLIAGVGGVFGLLAFRQEGNRRMSRHARGVAAMPVSQSGAVPALMNIQNVCKRYGKVLALDNISFEIGAGQSVALWGPNGAGKTTLLKAVLGLIQFEGRITVAGHEVLQDGKAARGKVGYVPQEFVFYDWTVQETLAFYARLKDVDAARIDHLLGSLGLSEHNGKPVPALSGGLKQRLALAIAMLSDPPILVLDEPTANLDARARRDYLTLLTELRKAGKTLVFASHRVEELDILADRVCVLEQGHLAETLTPGDFRKQYQGAFEMTLWLEEPQRELALKHLADQGFSARRNGHVTVIVQASSAQKMQVLDSLTQQGIKILDFELEHSTQWN